MKASLTSTTPLAKSANASTKLTFNRGINNAYRKSKTFNSNTTKNVKQRITSMHTRSYRSKSCYSHYPNVASANTNLAKNNTNDLKKLLEKKLNTNTHQPLSKATLIKPFKKRSASHFSRSNTRKEKDDILLKKGIE